MPSKRAMAKCHTIAVGCEASTRRSESCLVAVESEDRHLVPGSQERLGVTAAAERGVDDHTGGDFGENGDDLIDHDRDMLKFAGRGGTYSPESSRLQWS